MQAVPFKSRALVDYLYDFAKGVNNGISYALLPRDQLSSGVNTTVRGTFVGPRPVFRKITLAGVNYGDEAMIAAMAAGHYQGGTYYNPDSGTESLLASISGKLYQFAVLGTTATVSLESTAATEQDSTVSQHWLWQSEKWINWNDGVNNPVFWDPVGLAVRSNYGTPVIYTARNTSAFTVPAVATEVVVPFSDTTNLVDGDVVTHRYRGTFTVQNIAGLSVTLLNINASPAGYNVAVPAEDEFSWQHTGTQLPPGRMGAYGMGRNWVCRIDGKQFVASDLIGGSSGTVANNFRDAPLQITENIYLAGGGNFAVPGSYGEIRAMCFAETLDTSLGQGALQVFTPNTVFSCNAPVDRTTWQEVTNPILTESAKGGGGLGQWSTINANSDIVSRARAGLRSLILSRREANTWGNVPISREIQPQMDRDSDSLLGHTSAVVFDNRHLITTEGELIAGRGVIWKRLAVTNYDPISTLQGKAPAVYDALYWQGLNVFQLIKGEFDSVERCFAFTLNRTTNLIELWEILPSSNSAIYDDVDTRIVWSFESPMLDFGQRDPRVRERLSLGPSEISVNELRGKVSFQAYFRPEFWPCWVPWAAWEECSVNTDPSSTSPSFRPNMGLPEPNPNWCDEGNNRPLRDGYFFQVKLVVTGHCQITSWKFTADTVPQPPIAPPVCVAICP